MRIDHLELENFKNFEHLVADFGPGVNLFVGVNGTGKTALLEAVSVAAGSFFGDLAQNYQRYIRKEEIRIHNNKRQELTSVKAKGILGGTNAEWTRVKTAEGKNTSGGIAPAVANGKQVFLAFHSLDYSKLAPVIAYHSTQRLFKDSAQSAKQRYDVAAGRFNGYLKCLEEESIKPVLIKWLGNAVTNRATRLIQGILEPDLILENVEKAIRQTVIELFGLPSDFALKIYVDVNELEGELVLQFGDDQPLPINYFSDGLRNMLFLVIDLVWRCSQLNPLLGFDDLCKKAFGVVIIDEIDLHLHPRWQGKIIPLLQRFFPNVQFFITTHSPQVVANFKGGTLFTINNNEIQRVGASYYGKEVATITEQLMGAPLRNEDVQRRINALLRQIDQENLSPAAIDQELEAITSLTGLADREVLAIQAILDWKRYQSENDAVHQEG
jgi:predicted ATP-binding protein involved in virulence